MLSITEGLKPGWSVFMNPFLITAYRAVTCQDKADTPQFISYWFSPRLKSCWLKEKSDAGQHFHPPLHPWVRTAAACKKVLLLAQDVTACQVHGSACGLEEGRLQECGGCWQGFSREMEARRVIKSPGNAQDAWALGMLLVFHINASCSQERRGSAFAPAHSNWM